MKASDNPAMQTYCSYNAAAYKACRKDSPPLTGIFP